MTDGTANPARRADLGLLLLPVLLLDGRHRPMPRLRLRADCYLYRQGGCAQRHSDEDRICSSTRSAALG